MTNETITLSRELIHRAIDAVEQVGYQDKFIDYTFVRAVKNDLRAAMADPVPPAGGGPEVRTAFDAWFISDRSLHPQTDTTLIDGPFEPWRAWKACADQYSAHVTRLQAEVERWKANNMANALAAGELVKGLRAEVERLKTMSDNYCSLLMDANSELTKARELLAKLSDYAEDSASAVVRAWTKEARKILSNQSAPADKGEPVAYRCRHSENEPWFFSDKPGYWECQPLYTEQPAPVAVVMSEKYDDVLLPFLALMRAELHANASKGDRPGWLQMDRKTAVLEVFYHMGKLHQAVHRDEAEAIKEYAADVANMCMMLTDVCGCLNPGTKS